MTARTMRRRAARAGRYGVGELRATRRAVLGAVAATFAAGAALSACRPFGSGAPRRADPVDPDRPRLEAAVAAEVSLLAGYDAAITAAPTLAAVLSAIRAAHRAALDAELARPSPGRTAAPQPSSRTPAVRPPLAVPTPSPVARPDAATTVQDLTAAETANAAARSDDAIVAAAGALAAVLGSVAASEAVHATVLATVLATVPATGPGPGTPPASVPATVPGAGHSAVTDVDVLQTLLATENAAAYGYGVLGGHLASAERTVASQAENAHLARRAPTERLP